MKYHGTLGYTRYQKAYFFLDENWVSGQEVSSLRSRRKLITWILAVVLLGGLILWLWWGNSIISVSHYTIRTENPGLEGFTIVQISDLHSKQFGRGNRDLLSHIENSTPDIIAVTGDLISAVDSDFSPTLEFIRSARKIAPIYFVTGNHEAGNARYLDLQLQLSDLDVTLLQNEATVIDYCASRIHLIGMDDPLMSSNGYDSSSRLMEETLADLEIRKEEFTLLLSHRPELFQYYVQEELDLVLSGHAHGGQFRLPLVGALVAPDQGWLPALTEGSYVDGETTMVVSGGLGNSIIPLRINNPPELVVITLKGP